MNTEGVIDEKRSQETGILMDYVDLNAPGNNCHRHQILCGTKKVIEEEKCRHKRKFHGPIQPSTPGSAALMPARDASTATPSQ